MVQNCGVNKVGCKTPSGRRNNHMITLTQVSIAPRAIPVMNERFAGIAKSFQGLARVQKAFVLARIGHHETIHLREAIAFRSEDTDALHRLNNSVHCLAGYTMAVLSTDDLDRDMPFMAMMLSDLNQRHPYIIEKIAEWIADAPRRMS